MPRGVVHYNFVLELPDTPYSMWCRGELHDFLGVPEGMKIEVLGGAIEVDDPPGTFPRGRKPLNWLLWKLSRRFQIRL
jgi:hypothetical protein